MSDPGQRQSRRAMQISLAVGFLMLTGKLLAYFLTGSAAILSDAAESVVHVIAVSFAAYSLRLSYRPIDPTHPYGYDRVVYFSAGFEGAMIIMAAFYIIFEAVRRLITGFELQRLSEGTLLVAAAAVLNGVLGWYLVSLGKRERSLILEANGKHVLTDCLTSVGVIVGLGLVLFTGWKFFDPLVALLVAGNIMISGGGLVRRSIRGLMDEADPETENSLQEILESRTAPHGVTYHGLRHRHSGRTLRVEFHLLFPGSASLKRAHRLATEIEEKIVSQMSEPVEVISHLECLEDHASVHSNDHFEDFEGEKGKS